MAIIQIDLGHGRIALADSDDALILASRRWSAAKCGERIYACSKQGGCRIFMHRLILNVDADLSVDHINGDCLDNRRANLRVCTHAENMRNRRASRSSACDYKGIYRYRGRFRAQIRHQGVKHDLGVFNDQASAAMAYDRAAISLHGEFARTNFPASPTANHKTS